MNLNDNGNQPWAIGTFKDLIFNLTSDTQGIEGKLVCARMRLEDPNQPLCSDVIVFEDEGNSLECSLLIPSSDKVNPQQPKISINGLTTRTKIIFAPRFVKRLFQYLLAMGMPKKAESLTTPSPYRPRSKEFSCKKEVPEMEGTLTVKEMTLLCLHHEHNTPFLKGVIGETTFGYRLHIDHALIWVIFGDVEIFDMTNYPSTISPADFGPGKLTIGEMEKEYTFTKMLAVKPPRGVHNFEMYICEPDCVHKVERDVRNSMSVKFGELWLLYIQEVTLRRAMNYILEQLLYSLSPFDRFRPVFSNRNDAYEEFREEQEEMIKEGLADFVVYREFTKFNVGFALTE